MKLTKTKLKQIIREEFSALTDPAPIPAYSLRDNEGYIAFVNTIANMLVAKNVSLFDGNQVRDAIENMDLMPSLSSLANAVQNKAVELHGSLGSSEYEEYYKDDPARLPRTGRK